MRPPNSIRLTISISEIFRPGRLSLYLKSGKRLTSSLKRRLISRITCKIGASGQLADRHSTTHNTQHKPTHTTATHISDSVASAASALPSASANRRMRAKEWVTERVGGKARRALVPSNSSSIMFCFSIIISTAAHNSISLVRVPSSLSLAGFSHGARPAQHRRDRFQQQFQIECERPVVNVFEVLLNPAV